MFRDVGFAREMTWGCVELRQLLCGAGVVTHSYARYRGVEAGT